MSGIKVENIIKCWGTVCAVNNISFETGDAEFVALLGPSGCGKSTMLRLIAGLETVSSGSIFISGREVTTLPPSKRNLSMVFQSYALFPHLTVADNILFGLSVRGVSKSECATRLKRVVDLLGLGQLLDRRPSQLSGGQQQRVALGRALIAETPVCLLDEPLSNLDAQLRAEMRNEIRSLQQRLGIAMIFVTHDQTEAMSMADRIILMRAGEMIQWGRPVEFYERPSCTFAARFIGTPPMNVLDLVPGPHGLVIADASGPALSLAPSPAPSRAPGSASGPAVLGPEDAPPEILAGTRPLQVGLRPEDIVFSSEGQEATVISLEYFGADTITLCAIGEQRLSVRTPGRPGMAPGEKVHLAWRAGARHFFDKESGLRWERQSEA